MEEIEINEEEVLIKEEVCSSSRLEGTCTWDVYRKKMFRWKIQKLKVKIDDILFIIYSKYQFLELSH